MIFRQLFDRVSSTYTYLLAQRLGGEALLIDPVSEDVPRYLKLIEELGLKLVIAADTHIHADHITGLGALREHTGCVTAMGAHSRASCASLKVTEGARLELGGLSLEVLYTPGHTDDSIASVWPIASSPGTPCSFGARGVRTFRTATRASNMTAFSTNC